MSDLASVVVMVAVIGAICFVALLVRLWAIGGKGEGPIGPRRPPLPVAAPPSAVPSEFRALIRAESANWKPEQDWFAAIRVLDQLADSFGAGAPESPPPKKYSASWLERRVAQIEAIAGGPMTSQPSALIQPHAPTQNVSAQ